MKHAITSLVSAILICLFAQQVKAQSPTAAALGFNVFLQKGATLINNETEGPVAMGGDLTLAGSYQVATNYPGTYTVNNAKVGLLVGGKIVYQSGNGLQVNQNTYVKIGDSTGSYVWYKDQNNAYSPIRITPGANYNGSPKISLQANAQQLGVSATVNPVFQKGLIDFEAAFAQMKNKAIALSLCTDNCILTNANGITLLSHLNLPTQVKVNLLSGINTLNITGADLNAVQNFTYNNAPDATHILIVNVNASGTFNWNVFNSGGIGLTNCPFILYNFYNCTTLNIQGSGAVQGTVFAPYADIVKTSNQANIEGQVIAQSYYQNGGENHYAVFSPITALGCAIKPIAAFTVNTLTQCLTGNLFKCTPAVLVGSGPLTYLWKFSDGTTSTLASPTKTFSAAGTYTAKLYVTGPGGTDSVSQTLTVNTMPNIGFTINDTVQVLTGNNFTFLSLGLTVGLNYKWNFGDSTYSTLINPVKTYTKAGQYNVWQTVTNLLTGCKDSILHRIVVAGDSVGSGHNGGLESKSLGGLVNKRDYERIRNSQDARINYSTMKVFSYPDTKGMGKKSSEQQLPDMMPKQLMAGDVLRISTPTDLLSLTMAVEVLSVDYTINNRAQAVVLGLKTHGAPYNHTKSICDRLRGAQLLSVENVVIRNYNFTLFTMLQENGVTEYAISLVAGKKAGRANYSLQTNWLVSQYAGDDTLYTFQVWATQPEYTQKLVADIIDNLSSAQPLVQNETATLPTAYITRGYRSQENLVVYINNTTSSTSGKLVFEVRENEQATATTMEVPVTLTAGSENMFNIPVKDGYEYEGKFYIDDSVLVDAVYMADGNWGLDYDHSYTTVSGFTTANDPSRVYKNNEYAVYRNVDLHATSTDYITLYKAIKQGSDMTNLTGYTYLNFFAKGKGKVEIRMTRDSIINWADQYKATLTLDETGRMYSIPFHDFRSANISAPFNPSDIRLLTFTFAATNSQQEAYDLSVSNVSFSNTYLNTGIRQEKTAAAQSLAIYPNPSNGNFGFSFTADANESFDLELRDVLGRLVHTQKVQAVQGNNNVQVSLGNMAQPIILFGTLKNGNKQYNTQKIVIE